MPNMLCIPVLPHRLEGRSGSLKAALADTRPNVVQFCDKDRDCKDNKTSIEAARRGDGDARQTNPQPSTVEYGTKVYPHPGGLLSMEG